nr:hypothetical protein [Tanacetum cinerariifolium]
EAVNKEMDRSLERAATTATSLDAGHDRGVYTTRSGEDSLKLNESMGLYTKLQQRIPDLETTKTTQALEIDNLKRRVKKLERRKRSRTHRLKILYKVGLSAREESSKDEGLGEEDASKQGRIADIDANEDIHLVSVHNDEYIFCVNDLDGDEVIVKSVDVAEQAKEVIDDITLATALIDIKSAKPKADKLQAEEQEELTNAEKAKLFMQFLEKRRKFFSAKRAEEKRNKPPTRAQQRSIMTELVLESSKKAEAKVIERSSKRAREELEQENAKKQEMEDDKESTELKQCLEIILDDGDDVTIDATPLSSKSPIIVD